MSKNTSEKLLYILPGTLDYISHSDFKEKNCSFAKLFYFTEAYKERVVLKYRFKKQQPKKQHRELDSIINTYINYL